MQGLWGAPGQKCWVPTDSCFTSQVTGFAANAMVPNTKGDLKRESILVKSMPQQVGAGLVAHTGLRSANKEPYPSLFS